MKTRDLMLISLVVADCSSDSPTSVKSTPPSPPTVKEWNPILNFPWIPTYDSTGQAVHPDVAIFKGRTVVSSTPYPEGNPNHEKPSLMVWENNQFSVPGPNPVIDTAPRMNGVGLLSDPDIVADGDTLRMYFRVSTQIMDLLYLTRTVDLQNWTPPIMVDSESAGGVVSPTIVHEDSLWRMWGVAAQCGFPGAKVRERVSTDGITWGPWQDVELSMPEGGPWHIDVTKSPDGLYVMLVANQYAGTCHPHLYLATSSDGFHWKVNPKPLVTSLPGIDVFPYRSSLRFVTRDSIEIWLSGIDNAEKWTSRIAVTGTTLSELMSVTGGNQ